MPPGAMTGLAASASSSTASSCSLVAPAPSGTLEEKAHRQAFRKVEAGAHAARLSENEMVWRVAGEGASPIVLSKT